MWGSLLPDAQRPFKIYCASPSITSQLVLFLWQTVEIGPLGHVRVVEALQNVLLILGTHNNLGKSVHHNVNGTDERKKKKMYVDRNIETV